MRNKNQIYQKAIKLAKKYASSDPSHSVDHIKRALQLVEYIVKRKKIQQTIDLENLRLATILHDLGSRYQIKELKKSKDKFKSGEHLKYSLRIAEDFLKKEKLPRKQIEKVKEIIAAHGTYGKKGNIEGDVLHDADLLDGIGLVGVLRKFTYGGQIGRDVLASLEFTNLKIKNRSFRTEIGKKLGKERIKRVKNWLRKVGQEIEGKDLS